MGRGMGERGGANYHREEEAHNTQAARYSPKFHTEPYRKDDVYEEKSEETKTETKERRVTNRPLIYRAPPHRRHFIQ